MNVHYVTEKEAYACLIKKCFVKQEVLIRCECGEEVYWAGKNFKNAYKIASGDDYLKQLDHDFLKKLVEEVLSFIIPDTSNCPACGLEKNHSY